MKKGLLAIGGLLVGAVVVIAVIWGFDFEVTEEGELPRVEVEGGELPEADVEAPDIEVTEEEGQVPVPEVTMEEEEVTVPSIDVEPGEVEEGQTSPEEQTGQ